MHIELVVSDSCLTPELNRSSDAIQVRIGLSHDFDSILDICGPELDSETIGFIYRLWSDDDFPRNFIRVGDSLVITAREI
jgi:hypothetical protein